MRLALSAMVVLATLAASVPARAELYRWTDAAGRTHVTDTPPPANAKNVKKEAAPTASSGTPSEPFALQQARKDFPVKLYSTPSCDACSRARSLLNARGIPFTEKSVIDLETIDELKKAADTDRVPALLVGSDVVKGYDEGSYNIALDSAGYPKAGVLPPRKQAAPATASPNKAADAPQAEAEPEKLGPYAPKPPRGK
jgi:glutaredoxin